MARTLTAGLIRATPLVHTTSVITLPFTETWATGGDATGTLDGDFIWNDFIGTHQWQRASDRARLFGATGVTQGGYLNRNCGTDDVAVTLTYAVWTPGTNTLVAGPMVRMTGTPVFTGYCAALIYGDGTTNVVLYRFLAGGQTAIAPAVTVTPHAGMTVGVSALGNRIRASFDGAVRIDLTDGGIPSGRYVGLQGFNNGTGDVQVETLAASQARAALAKTPLEFLTLRPLTGVR